MINRSWIKPTRVLLVILLIILCVWAAKAYTIGSQGTYRAKGVYSLPHGLTASGSSYITIARAEGTHTPTLRQDLILQVKGDSDVERSSQRERANIWLTLLGVFLGGLALNLTPCIYPLIPITISYFGGRSERIRGHTIVHGMLYILGLAMTNSSLGLSAALSGGMFGAWLQKPYVLIFVAAVMVTMALSFFGLWELRLPMRLTQVASKQYAGFFGTFFMGLTLGIVAAPCLGPFLLGLLIYVGQKGDPFLGFLYFFVLSIGLGLPLSILAVFSSAIAKLPKSGDWMLWIRKLMAWVLIGMAAYMVGHVVSGLLGKHWLLAGVLTVAGIHLGWLDKTGSTLRIFPYLKKAVGIAMVCGAIIYPVLTIQHASAGIKWIPYDESIIAKAMEEGKPVIIDFYADWCRPCVAMEKEVFTDPEVIKLSRNCVTVRLDLTIEKPFHREVLKKYGVRGIPTVVFINRDGVEDKQLRIKGHAGKSEFLDRLKRLLEGPSST